VPTESITFNGLSLLGELEVFDEEVAANIETQPLPGYEGVYVPGIRRGPRSIRVEGKILAASADDARAIVDAIGRAFGDRELASLYLWADRCTQAYVESFSTSYIEGVAHAIELRADFICPVPVWQEPAVTSSMVWTDPTPGGALTNRSWRTQEIDYTGTAPSWPILRNTSHFDVVEPLELTWRHYGRNLLRNTRCIQGSHLTYPAVPLHWETDSWGDALRFYSYRANRGLMLGLGAGSTLGASIEAYQRVPFHCEDGGNWKVSAWARAWRRLGNGAGKNAYLKLSILNAALAELDSVEVQFTADTSGSYEETVALDGLAITADTRWLEYKVWLDYQTMSGDGENLLWLLEPALTISALGMWPGHSEYAELVWSLPDCPAGAVWWTDSAQHEAWLQFPGQDPRSTSGMEYFTGSWPVWTPPLLDEQHHVYCYWDAPNVAAGDGVIRFDQLHWRNYWSS
jgi:hypothetical protein